jgi:hypothetical protein
MSNKELEDFVSNLFGVADNISEAQARDNEHQAALRERAKATAAWRAYVNEAVPAETLDGPMLRSLREQCGLTVGDVSDICGLSPETVRQAEDGKVSFAAGALKRFAGAARDAVLARGNEA